MLVCRHATARSGEGGGDDGGCEPGWRSQQRRPYPGRRSYSRNLVNRPPLDLGGCHHRIKSGLKGARCAGRRTRFARAAASAFQARIVSSDTIRIIRPSTTSSRDHAEVSGHWPMGFSSTCAAIRSAATGRRADAITSGFRPSRPDSRRDHAALRQRSREPGVRRKQNKPASAYRRRITLCTPYSMGANGRSMRIWADLALAS